MLLYVFVTALVIALAQLLRIFRALALYFRVMWHVKPQLLTTTTVHLSMGRSFHFEVSTISEVFEVIFANLSSLLTVWRKTP